MVQSILISFRPKYFCRAYQISHEAFQILHGKLEHWIESDMKGGNCSLPPIPNGAVDTEFRLAYAIWYFCGASLYDLMAKYHVSICFVVKAVNTCIEFEIKYPSKCCDKKTIVNGFADVSDTGLMSCASAIDGILIWIQKPSENQVSIAEAGREKISVVERINLD